MSKDDIIKRIEESIKNLKSPDLETRQQAAWDLKKFAEEKIKETNLAIPALLEAINDSDWAVRKMAIMTLGELNTKEATPKIIELLKIDEEPEVRVGAAEALGNIKDEQAVPALIQALDDSYEMLQQVTMWSLGKMGQKAKIAVPKILEFLIKPEYVEVVQINNLAAWALGEIGDKSAIEPLKKALYDASYHERKFTIAYSLALLEGSNGEGFAELQKMKDNYELEDYELELLEKMKKEK